MTNAASRKDVRNAEKEAKIADRERQNLIRGLMDSSSGRRWMHDLLYACHMFTTSFAPDTNTMAFREGERNIGLRLLADIMLCCPEQYVQMMREENERRTAKQSADDTAGDDPDDPVDYWGPNTAQGTREYILDR